MIIYIAASFKHMHGVRLLGRELGRLGCKILDWTAKASPPPGLTPLQRREWMDTDQDGGQVYTFCRDACGNADLVIYYGESGQDAGVEIGLAAASGAPILGIRGPLEAPGLMLHGAVTTWVEGSEEALNVIGGLLRLLDASVAGPVEKAIQGEELKNIHPACLPLFSKMRQRGMDAAQSKA